MEEMEISVIGAGVVGLAIAERLSRKFRSVIVLERNGAFGRETSSRNSEVIHCGIYYPKNSLKARLCVTGAPRLYELCARFDIGHKRVGKLIVATEDNEREGLRALYAHGLGNEVEGLRLIDGQEARSLEPTVCARAAIHSANTGIVNSHELMKLLHGTAQNAGAMFAFGQKVNLIDRRPDGYVIGVEGDDFKFKSRVVVNAAGLWADTVAGLAGIDIERFRYRLKYCKGSYFSYSRRSPISRLVYPLPEESLRGLGVHATVDLAGRLKFGPDTEYVEGLEYSVDKGKRKRFFESAAKIIAGLDAESFAPDMAGVRPKLSGPGESERDFVIEEESAKGLPGFINLVGIESPGLTASLAIAELVAGMAEDVLG